MDGSMCLIFIIVNIALANLRKNAFLRLRRYICNMTFADILTVVLALGSPVLVGKACRRWKWLDSIGPIMLLYALGLVAGLLGLKAQAQELVTTVTLPLAIPLILMGNSLKGQLKGAKDTVLAFFSCLTAAILAVVISYLVFRPSSEVVGMVAGCATGGTMNMASVKMALGVDESLFVLLNTYDMAVSFVYMMFLLVFGIRLARRFLPVKDHGTGSAASAPDGTDDASLAGSSARKATVGDYAVLLGIAALCCGAGYSATLLFDPNSMMLVFILVLTALGIGLSFVRKISSKPGSYDMGMYLIYAFSFTVASMADFRNMSIGENGRMLAFFAGVVFGSLLLHMLFSKILKIDADTAVIASNAFVNAPPSVPVISSAMKNPKALTSGLTIGIVGYAIGTYLGIFLSGICG